MDNAAAQTDYSSLDRYEFNAFFSNPCTPFLFFPVLKLCECTIDLPCNDLCLQAVAQYNCTVDGDGDGNLLIIWTVPNPNNSEDTENLNIFSFEKTNVTDTTDTFTAVVTDVDPFVSTLSFNTTNQLNNKEIKCESGGIIKTCTIMILGI